MDIGLETTPPSRLRARAALAFVAKGDPLATVAGAFGAGFARQARLLARREAFGGGAGQVLVLHERPGARVETLVLAGLGDPGSAGADVLRTAAAEGARAARDAGAD